jgi:hypothetical protein
MLLKEQMPMGKPRCALANPVATPNARPRRKPVDPLAISAGITDLQEAHVFLRGMIGKLSEVSAATAAFLGL